MLPSVIKHSLVRIADASLIVDLATPFGAFVIIIIVPPVVFIFEGLLIFILQILRSSWNLIVWALGCLLRSLKHQCALEAGQRKIYFH